MPGGWTNSTGHTRSHSASHRAFRAAVLTRDPLCQLAYSGVCTGTSTEADHIVSPLDGGTDDPTNGRGVCGPCHRVRTSRQGNAARPRQARATERHPGLT